MAGIVYYANYLKYIERARSDWVRGLGVDQNALKDTGTVFAVRRIEADYLAPARLDDMLTITVVPHSATAARAVLHQEVRRGATVLFKAVVTVVAIGSNGRATRLPAVMR